MRALRRDAVRLSPVLVTLVAAIFLLFVTLTLVTIRPADGSVYFEGKWYNAVYTDDLDESWYTSEKLPDVDLEGLVANLSAQISWFKYVGNATLTCAARAKTQDTLMMAIEDLQDCLFDYYKNCSSEYAEPAVCDAPITTNEPCSTFRFGIKGETGDGLLQYQPYQDCRWLLQVPEDFIINMTMDYFNMESSGVGCPYDWAMIYDGNNITARSYGRYCGWMQAFTIYGSTGEMLITSHTDGSIGKVGFRGVFQVMDAGMGITMNGTHYIYADRGNGSFSMSDYLPTRFESYAGDYFFTEWHIQVDPTYTLQIDIEFMVGHGAMVEVYDGIQVWNKQILKYEYIYNGTNDGVPEFNITETFTPWNVETAEATTIATTEKQTPLETQTTTEKITPTPKATTASANESVLMGYTSSPVMKNTTDDVLMKSLSNDTVLEPYPNTAPPDQKPTAPFSTAAQGNDTIMNPFIPKSTDQHTPTEPYSTAGAADPASPTAPPKSTDQQTPTEPYSTAGAADPTSPTAPPKSTDQHTPTEPYSTAGAADPTSPTAPPISTEQKASTEAHSTTASAAKILSPAVRHPMSDSKRYSFISSGFQIFMVVRQLKTDDGTWLNVNYSSMETTQEKFKRRHKETPICKATHGVAPSHVVTKKSAIDLDPSGEPTVLKLEAVPWKSRLAISCYWEVTAPEGMFVRMHVENLDFKSPNEKHCAMAGMLMADGPKFNDSYMRLGPNCYRQPIGLFGFRKTGVNNLTTTGNKFVIHLYSYGKIPYIERHGVFRVIMRATHCQGMIQPCSNPVNWTTDHFSLLTMPMSGMNGEPDLNITFSCDKSKCCVIQQYPIYDYMNDKTCRIQVITHGNKVLATSQFNTNMAVPDKADAFMSYGCQRKENMLKFHRGPHQRRCKGTTTHLEYHSSSQWSIGAFTMSVAPAPCGYYRPDLHYENIMYPPCAQAEMPVSMNSSQIKYIDYNNTDFKYYSMVFKYRNDAMCQALGPTCGEAEVRIYGNNTYTGWAPLTMMPIQWKTFGKSSEVQSYWMRDLTVIRNYSSICDFEQLNQTKACELSVDFRDEEMPRGPPLPDKTISCPDGFEKVASWCYMLLWPESAELGVPVKENFLISTEEAENRCKKQNGHLVSINEQDEHDALLLHIHYSWWPAYLQYIPGAKIFHIGLKKESDYMYRWWSGEPATFTFWNQPDYHSRLPDISGFSDDSTEPLKLVQSKLVEKALRTIHPMSDDESKCTVLVVFSIHLPARWVKVPCDEPITTAIPLCEAEPITQTRPNNKKLGASVRTDDHGNRLVLPMMDCPSPYSTVGEKCFLLRTNPHDASGIAKKETPTSSCGAHRNGRIANVSHEDLEILSLMLTSWKHNPDSGSIRIRHQVDYRQYTVLLNQTDEEKKNAMDRQSCYMLEPVPSFNNSNGIDPVYKWVITDMKSDCSNDVYLRQKKVFSYICEVDPVPVTDRCATNHFRCNDGTCILIHLKCDGINHCLDRSDETNQNCSEICWWTKPGDDIRWKRHKPNSIPETRAELREHVYHRGQKQRTIFHPPPNLSDREMASRWNPNCFRNCPVENCTCGDLYFQCHSGGCIPASKICDQISHCKDGSDELTCNPYLCDGYLQYLCDNGQCISERQKCDFMKDCYDGSDEIDCHYHNVCQQEPPQPTKSPTATFFGVQKPLPDLYFQCDVVGGAAKCIPKSLSDDLWPDCPGPSPTDEQRAIRIFSEEVTQNKTDGSITVPSYLWCSTGDSDVGADIQINCESYDSKVCIIRNETCVYDRDDFGAMTGCRTGGHLNNCKHRSCGTMYKCPNSYCLPIHRVCDGVSDCKFGEDELLCENFYCPGMFMCEGSKVCIRQSQVCDGKVDCPLRQDDESLCTYQTKGCPTGCECLGQAVSCAQQNITNLNEILGKLDKQTRVLILRDNNIEQIQTSETADLVAEFTMLYKLDLSYNNLPTFGEINLRKSHMLIELYLDNNEIGSITRPHFEGAWKLLIITLFNNQISLLNADVFDGLKSLVILDLSGQDLRSLDKYYFAGMESIEVVNVTHNDIENVNNLSLSDSDARERPLPIRTLRFMDIRNNPLEKAEYDALKFLTPQVTLATDRFKYCCFARHVKHCLPEPDEFSSCENLVDRIELRVALWALSFLAIIGNMVVLHQRMKYEKETTPSILVQHLAFADFVMGAYCMIIAAADTHMRGEYIVRADDWRNHALCKLAAFLSLLSSEMSIYCVMLITLDRLLAVVPACNSHGLSMKAARGLVALGWTLSAVFGVVPILGFDYFGPTGLIRNGVCSMFNQLEGRTPAWEYTMSIFVGFNFIAALVMTVGYVFAWKSYVHGAADWPVSEELEEEERLAELEFRKNEMVITRRLVMIVLTNVVLWAPMIGIGAFAMIGIYVNKTVRAWITLFFIPLNAAINPYMYTLNVKPYRILIDELLANWVEGEADEDEEDDDDDDEDEKADTEVGDSSMGASTSMGSKTESSGLSESHKPRNILKDAALKNIL